MSVVVLDDRDSAIKYSGMWTKGGTLLAEYQGTTTFSVPTAATFATLVFAGTGITVLGSIPDNTVQVSNFSIDGGPSTMFTSTSAPETRYSQPFFSLGPGTLSPGVNHTLVMTPVQTRLIIDLITVDVLISAIALPSVSPTASPGSATTCPALCDASHTSRPLGPIIGSVLGGLGLVCTTIFLIMYVMHRKRNQDKGLISTSGAWDGQESRSQMRPSVVLPYDLSVSTTNPSAGSSFGRNASSSNADSTIEIKSRNVPLTQGQQTERVSVPPPQYFLEE